MKNKSFFLFGFFMLTLIFAVPFRSSGDGGFRCGGRIIEAGQTQDYVRQECGEPSNIETRTERLERDFNRKGYRYVLDENKIEIWTYNPGATEFVRYLTFKNGKLIDVRTGGYGF